MAGCAPIAWDAPRVVLAGTAPDGLRITFLGHASFLIETPQGVRAVTDYNGLNVPEDPPDIATMNHAHSSHYTDHPDPRIKYVLHGWRKLFPLFSQLSLHVLNELGALICIVSYPDTSSCSSTQLSKYFCISSTILLISFSFMQAILLHSKCLHRDDISIVDIIRFDV